MGRVITWRSDQGKLTADNRDWAGIGLRADSVLCILLDGSSSGENSGELAGEVVRQLVDWFVTGKELSAKAIVDQLCAIHSELAKRFRRDSASYIIALVDEHGTASVLHAGDCLAGVCDRSSSTQWRTQPHTLANAVAQIAIEDIARSPIRNRITRNLRAREFMVPDVSVFTLRTGETLVLATDGFWATLDTEQQKQFLAGRELTGAEAKDDRSVLCLTFVDGRTDEVERATGENFYVVDARE